MKTAYKIEISPKKFWFLLIPVALLTVFLLGLISYFVVDKMVMPGVTGMTNKGEVTIPAVKGLSLKEAKKLSYDRGLRVSESNSEYSDVKAAGLILSQEPEEGAVVKKGRHIFVVTSKGPEVDTLPDVSGMLEGPAKRALRSAGFFEISVRSVYSKNVEQNMSIGTEPRKNTVTSRAAKIVLFLSKGARPTHAVVPNIVGEMLSKARVSINDAGLKIGKITYEESAVMGPGQVIRQSASSGARITLESRIDLVVSKR